MSNARKLANRSTDTASVKDFGAVGDGTTDDSAAFANADTSAKLQFMPKTSLGYTFSSPYAATESAFFPDPSMTWANATDSGQFNFVKGFYNGNIWRFADRVFVGGAASQFAGNSASVDNGTSWFDNVNNPGYLGINAHLLVLNSSSNNGNYGVVAGLKSSLAARTVIGFGSAIVADQSGASCWAFIAELQREVSDNWVYGLEVPAKNKGSNTTSNPNQLFPGLYGVNLFAGGDPSFGGAPTNPSTAGVVFTKGGSTWNTGILFIKDSLTNGEAVSLSSEGVGGAHRLQWYNAAGNQVFRINSTATDAYPWAMGRSNNGLVFSQNNVALWTFGSNVDAVNGFNFYPALTGVSPQIVAQGSDSNIDLMLTPKGTGNVRFGTYAATGDVACNGYITVKDSGGNTRKLMTTV